MESVSISNRRVFFLFLFCRQTRVHCQHQPALLRSIRRSSSIWHGERQKFIAPAVIRCWLQKVPLFLQFSATGTLNFYIIGEWFHIWIIAGWDELNWYVLLPSGPGWRAEQQWRPPRPIASDHRLFHSDITVHVVHPDPEPCHASAGQPQQSAPPAPAFFHGGLPKLPTHTAAGQENPGAASSSGTEPGGSGVGGEHPECSGVRSGAYGRGCTLCKLYRTGMSFWMYS